MTDIWCDTHTEETGNQTIPAEYALSLSESNSAGNMVWVCGEHLKPQLDFMLDFNLGSVDVQSMKFEPAIIKTTLWENPRVQGAKP